MKTGAKIIICAAAFIFSCLAAAVGWGFMGGSGEPFHIRVLCGFILNMPPIFIIAMIRMIFTKEK